MEKGAERRAEHQANICSVFSNSKRIQILWTLTEGERSVGYIANAVDASLQNTSHHLRLMKDKGILRSRHAGRNVHYRIAQPELVSCLLLKSTR